MSEDEQKPVLEFCDVAWADGSYLVSNISGVSVSLNSSELVVVFQDEYEDRLPICDLASGLVDPAEGKINFLGKNWRHMSPCQQSDMRAKIGTVFEFPSWISSMTVYENIVLAERYNTTRSDSDIRSEVEEIAHDLGIAAIPDGRPDAVRPAELRKCELIRAFIGAPVLLLLESPELGLPSGTVPFLKDLLAKALARGAAAIWITQSDTMCNNINLRNTRKYKKNNDKIEIKEE